MKEQIIKYFQGVGHQIQDEPNIKLNGTDFELLTINKEGNKHYIKIIEKIESNDVYSPKGDINRKVDDITRLMRTLSSDVKFSITVPNEYLYKRILTEKLSSNFIKGIGAFLIDEKITDLKI